MRRLIIRPGAIGDCLLALPAIEFLQTGETELWVPSALCPLVGSASGLKLDRVRAISSTGLDRLGLGDGYVPPGLGGALQRFDDIVTWYGENRAEFQDAARRLNPQWRFLRALPPGDCSLHASDYFLSQVGGTLGRVPRLAVGTSVPHGAVAIHPFSGHAAKNWPIDGYRQLAKRLADTAEVVLLAGPDEELDGARRFEDLRKLADWLSGAALFIGNDSGPAHLAAAVGVPVVTLFGPTDPAIWAPRGPGVTVIRREPLESLTVDEVESVVRRVESWAKV